MRLGDCPSCSESEGRSKGRLRQLAAERLNGIELRRRTKDGVGRRIVARVVPGRDSEATPTAHRRAPRAIRRGNWHTVEAVSASVTMRKAVNTGNCAPCSAESGVLPEVTRESP